MNCKGQGIDLSLLVLVTGRPTVAVRRKNLILGREVKAERLK